MKKASGIILIASLVTITVVVGFYALNGYSNFDNDLSNNYPRARKFYGNKLTSHFPNSNIIGAASILTSYSVNNISDLQFAVKMEIFENADSLESYYSSISAAQYSADDECLFVVNRFFNFETFFDPILGKEDSLLIDRPCYLSKLPIPNFWKFSYFPDDNRYEETNTVSHLERDYRIYVLEAEPGIHFNKKYLADSPWMPKNWEHGYSRGVAISKQRNIIIYWLQIW